MFYTLAKQQTLAKCGPVLIVVGDDLVLRKGEKRTQARVIPEIYHTLKTFDHIALALDVALAAHADETPLGADFLNELRDYRGLFPAAGERIDKCRSRRRAMCAAEGDHRRMRPVLDSVVDKRQCSPAERIAFTRKMTPLLMANASAAARAALDLLHRQVCEWKAELTPQEWNELTVLVIGRQLPRKDNLAVQYFARLLGQAGEGKRLIYAEGLGDEPRALDLLATHRVDTQIGIDFFNDPKPDGSRPAVRRRARLSAAAARSTPMNRSFCRPHHHDQPRASIDAYLTRLFPSSCWDGPSVLANRLTDRALPRSCPSLDGGGDPAVATARHGRGAHLVPDGASWDPMLQLPADVAMCYGVGSDLGPRIKQWKEQGYIVHVMTGVAWGNYQDYLYGRFDGKRHVDEAQTDRHGQCHLARRRRLLHVPWADLRRLSGPARAGGHRRRRMRRFIWKSPSSGPGPATAKASSGPGRHAYGEDWTPPAQFARRPVPRVAPQVRPVPRRPEASL